MASTLSVVLVALSLAFAGAQTPDPAAAEGTPLAPAAAALEANAPFATLVAESPFIAELLANPTVTAESPDAVNLFNDPAVLAALANSKSLEEFAAALPPQTAEIFQLLSSAPATGNYPADLANADDEVHSELAAAPTAAGSRRLL